MTMLAKIIERISATTTFFVMADYNKTHFTILSTFFLICT